MKFPVITLKAWKRPEYFKQTVNALAQCDEVAGKHIIISIDGGFPAQQHEMVGFMESHELTHMCEVNMLVHPVNLGCAANTRSVLGMAFDQYNADYVIHLEDDTLPARDFISYSLRCGDEFENDRNTFSVSGYNRIDEGDVTSLVNLSFRRDKFSCWGWATWRRIWEEVRADWFGIVWTPEGSRLDAHHEIPSGPDFLKYVQKTPKGSWAWPMNKYWRGDRVEIAPAVSRIQNIGMEGGLFNVGGDWHMRNQHTPIWIENAGAEPDGTWTCTDITFKQSKLCSKCQVNPRAHTNTELCKQCLEQTPTKA